MTNEEIEKEKKNIDKMTHYELAHLWRHSYLGHPYFQNKDLNILVFLDDDFSHLLNNGFANVKYAFIFQHEIINKKTVVLV